MDIVRSAKKNVKIRSCVIEKDEILVPVVQDMMRLFEIPAVLSDVENDKGCCPEGAIVVKNKYEATNQAVLITEIFYWRETGVLGCVIKRSTTDAADEEPLVAVKRMLRLHLLQALSKITGHDPSPWGILRGVRPTKIIHRLLDCDCDKQDIIEKMQSLYAVTKEKSQLITNIAYLQRPFLPARYADKSVSIYVGIPYCPSRCLYCSFPAYVIPQTGNQMQLFLSAIEQDIKNVVEFITRYQLKVENVYIGGGTPTSLNDSDFEWLLALIKNSFVSDNTLEFTVEAGRPDSINEQKIAAMVRNGVSRVSVNPQSMQEKTLRHIGRMHSVRDTIAVFNKIRNVIPVVNMDIIAGLPGESIDDMADTLQQIKQLNPDNLTVHTLALKRGSRLKEHLGEYTLPDEQTTIEMTRLAGMAAEDMGMRPYYLYRQKYMTGNLENIGYARPNTECRYNIQIMEERQTIIGIGPAAGTKAVDTSTWRLKNCYNAKDVLTYINDLDRYVNKREKVLNEIYAVCKEEP